MKRYYSTFYHRNGGKFAFHNPDKTFIEAANDGRCDQHWHAYHDFLYPKKPRVARRRKGAD